jgi:hypothetical protein
MAFERSEQAPSEAEAECAALCKADKVGVSQTFF